MVNVHSLDQWDQYEEELENKVEKALQKIFPKITIDHFDVD